MKKQDNQKDSENKHFIDEDPIFDPRRALELHKAYKASKETFEKVCDIFQQGDSRYINFYESIIVAGFIDNDAIKIKKIEEKVLQKPSEEELSNIEGPQKLHKFYASKIAEKKGFIVKEYEKTAFGSRVDVFASDESKDLFIECCSCGIHKPIDFLSDEHSLLWVVLREIVDDKLTIFEFTRGPNWDDFKNRHDDYSFNQIQALYEDKLAGLFSQKPAKKDQKLTNFENNNI